ncbi:MAG: RICIN domain-containing protein [Micromonosporaceae bacterium]|nr:RICIN domain-containing protein [Micromonosporaceae bacterium]
MAQVTTPPRPDDASGAQSTTGSEGLPLDPNQGSPSNTPEVLGSGRTPATGTSGTPAGRNGTGAGPGPSGVASQTRAQQVVTVRIIGLAGKCLGAAGGATADGTAVDLYSCVGDATQTWELRGDNTIRTGGKCMAVAGGATADGTRVQLRDCTGTTVQQWTYSAGYDLVNRHADKCIDLKDRSSADYTVTQIWTCNGGSHQKWTLR